jgi:nucleoside-diphosphate-sugar epimerase
VFAAAAAHVERLVYTSSVAAYGFHADNPQPLTEDVEPRGSERFYYSAQKAELERALEEETRPELESTCCGRASSPARTRRC